MNDNIRKMTQTIAALKSIERVMINKLIVSDLAVRATPERLFPASKNRSARIRKKLIKRFGGEFRTVPIAYQTPEGFIIHPSLYKDLIAAVPEKLRSDYECRFTEIYRGMQ
jgi:hypothetical protein